MPYRAAAALHVEIDWANEKDMSHGRLSWQEH
jgi:hypothetical protein